MTYPLPDLPAGNGSAGSLPDEVWDRLERVLDHFENAWRRGEQPDLEEYLATAAAERRALLRELVQEDLEYRCRAGETIRAESYLERFPELRDDPALVADLTAVAQRFLGAPAGNAALPERPAATPLAGQSQTPHAEPSAAPAVADFPQLPGYEVTAVLGRGGMGVVYQARHRPLNRPVALKMILAGVHAGPEERERFRHEAEAVARFQHPNIVQVYEVGDHDARPYVALEFVAGGSLAQQLAGAPRPPREAARLVETLARAIHYAHQHGVVHRDLKPANILLSPGPEGLLIPKITDFGLAKRLDGEAGQTPSGAPLGTPSYMAPEQAGGGRDAGPAADLYSLGAILYEMLTGRPPFRGTSVLETLEQVRDEEPVPPGRFQRQLPRDLETICLKCLQKEPGRRYASAAALADDLARFLAGEPIRARPVRAWERGLKWARRRPLGAALLLVSLAALVGLVAGAVLIDEQRREADRQAAAAREQEEKARANEEKARANYERAERSYRLAQAAMEKLLAKLRADPRFRQGAWEDLRRTLLQAELEFYTQFVEQRGDEPAFKAERAQAYLRLAQVTRELDGGARAVAPAQEALARFTELARDHHEEVAYVAQRDKSQRLMGLCYPEFDHVAASPALLKDSLAAVKILAAAHPEDVDYLKQQAVILNSLAIVERQNLNWEEAERLWKEATAIRRTLVERFPDEPALLFGLAKCLNNVGSAYALRLRAEEGRRALTEAQRLMKSLIEKYPDKASYRDFLALVDFHLVLTTWGRASEAEQPLEEGLALAKPLVDKYPTVPGYRTTLVVLQVRLAELLWHRGKVDAAFALYTDAIRAIPPDQAREPTYARALESLVQAHVGQARCLGQYGRHREAVWEWEKALELEPYSNPLHRLECACDLARLGDHAEATRATDAVVKRWQDPVTLFNAANAYAVSVAAVEKGSPLAERYGARAVSLLRQASAGGYRGFGMLIHEPNLEPIWQRQDFRQLLRELRASPRRRAQ